MERVRTVTMIEVDVGVDPSAAVDVVASSVEVSVVVVISAVVDSSVVVIVQVVVVVIISVVVTSSVVVSVVDVVVAVTTVVVLAGSPVVVVVYGSSRLHCDAKSDKSGLSQSSAQSVSPHDSTQATTSAVYVDKNPMIQLLQSTVAKAPFSTASAKLIPQTAGRPTWPDAHLCNSGKIIDAPEKVELNWIPGFTNVISPSKSHTLHNESVVDLTNPMATNVIAINIFLS